MIFLSITSLSIDFPMESHGTLGGYLFFETDVEHFIYGTISNDVTVIRIDDFSWHLGMSIDTYMGKSWNNPDMKFNIYGGHWNITTQFDIFLDPVLVRLYTDHECFHNIDMPDTLSEYMNNIKLGVVYTTPSSFEYFDDPGWFPNSYPAGGVSIGLYRPSGDTFQKGHDFDWSMHGECDFQIIGFRSWLSGLRYYSDIYFHRDGDSSSRHRGELYLRYNGSVGMFETHITHYFRDTQPFRSLEGESYWGVRFLW